ncbi:MAG: helix-turn-helix transcriptional regulator [Clostridiales Family XIII bacterium]|nr:helix-turn-helix transcriptional regulator [Clostridia bacterium]MDY3011458.1 helix-turn-helix transcriptional regulator [Clostridiales Family XIII bacterium]
MKYRIKECRQEEGLSQEQLSKKADVSRAIVSGLETGAITTTSTKTLEKIASALNKNVSDIFLD